MIILMKSSIASDECLQTKVEPDKQHIFAKSFSLALESATSLMYFVKVYVKVIIYKK